MKTKKSQYPPGFIAAVKAQNRDRALYEAIVKEGDDVEGVIAAVNAGGDLNYIFVDRLPLEWTIHLKKFNRFKTLLDIVPPEGSKPLDLYAPVFVTEKKVEMSYLHHAAVKGLSQFVEYLVVQKKMDTTRQDKHGRRLLAVHHAAGSGSRTTLNVFGKQQAITAVSGEGDFCIHIAVTQGRKPMVEHLLALGADVKCRNNEGRTPLHCAVLWRQKEMVAFLLTQKASTQDVDNRGRNAYLLAVEIGEIDLVDSLVLPGDSYAIQDSNGMNAMHVAAENNNVPMMKSLKDKKGLFVDVKDTKGRIPIHIATEHDSLEVFNFIINDKRKKLLNSLSKKVDPSILEKAVNAELQATLLSWQDSKGDTVIEYAVRAKATKILAPLAELGIKLDRANNLGCTLMHEAAEEGDVEKVVLLSRYGVGTNKKNNAGQRPEHVAAAHGRITVLEALQKVPGVDFKAKDDDGMMPSHWAASAGHKDTLEWLLQHNGGKESDTDNHGRNCLFHAVRGDHAELIIHLVKVRKMSLYTFCSKKMTVMHHAVFKSAEHAILTLKNLGMSLEAKSGDQGMLPLDLASRSGLPQMVDFLVLEGANKDACNDMGRNAWFYAAGVCQDQEMFKCLERHNILLHGVLDKFGMSPVHGAAIGGNLIGLKYILAKGLSHSAQSTSGETPLIKAINNREKIEKELLEKKNSPEYLSGEDKKLLEECEKLEARIVAYKEVENHLMALDQQFTAIEQHEEPREKQTEVVTKRERTDEPDDEKVTRVIKPKKASVDQRELMGEDPEAADNHRPKM